VWEFEDREVRFEMFDDVKTQDADNDSGCTCITSFTTARCDVSDSVEDIVAGSSPVCVQSSD